jgi:hypothetical protein
LKNVGKNRQNFMNNELKSMNSLLTVFFGELIIPRIQSWASFALTQFADLRGAWNFWSIEYHNTNFWNLWKKLLLAKILLMILLATYGIGREVLVSWWEKWKKIIADFHVLGIFMAKKHDLSEKKFSVCHAPLPLPFA